MKHTFLLISLLFLVFSPTAEAGKVMKVKGEKVYILFNQDDPFAEGDYFILNNDEGKKLGLVQLKKVKGLKAIGVLKKGKADKGYSTTFKAPGKKAKKTSVAVEPDASTTDDSDSSPSSQKSRMGVLVGYGMASQDVNQGGQGVSSQSGSSIAVRGVYDYPLFESVFVRAMAGTEFLSVTGDGAPLVAPTTRTTIGTDITYMALDALFHWSVMKGRSSNIYLIGGMAILYPLAKTSDAILEDSIDSLAIGEFGAGFEWKLNNYTLPFEVTYYYFPSGADVETNVISFKLGLLF